MNNAERGRKGGRARAAALTPEQRSESARKAVQARWAKRHHTAPPPNITFNSKSHTVYAQSYTLRNYEWGETV